jgi:hypothetical protein
MDDISPPQFTAMDQAASVASYARPLLIVTNATAETWAAHLALLCVRILVRLANFRR